MTEIPTADLMSRTEALYESWRLGRAMRLSPAAEVAHMAQCVAIREAIDSAAELLRIAANACNRRVKDGTRERAGALLAAASKKIAILRAALGAPIGDCPHCREAYEWGLRRGRPARGEDDMNLDPIDQGPLRVLRDVLRARAQAPIVLAGTLAALLDEALVESPVPETRRCVYCAHPVTEAQVQQIVSTEINEKNRWIEAGRRERDAEVAELRTEFGKILDEIREEAGSRGGEGTVITVRRLKADLARVTAERDELNVAHSALYDKLREAEKQHADFLSALVDQLNQMGITREPNRERILDGLRTAWDFHIEDRKQLRVTEVALAEAQAEAVKYAQQAGDEAGGDSLVARLRFLQLQAETWATTGGYPEMRAILKEIAPVLTQAADALEGADRRIAAAVAEERKDLIAVFDRLQSDVPDENPAEFNDGLECAYGNVLNAIRARAEKAAAPPEVAK